MKTEVRILLKGKTEFCEILAALRPKRSEKGRTNQARPVFADDIHKSLFDLEFVLMECDFVNILGLAS